MIKNCKFRDKEVMCGYCYRITCKYPKESPDVWNPAHEDECWRYRCNIDRSKCNGDCLSKVKKRIKDLEEENRDWSNAIRRNEAEILKLKTEFTF